MDKIIKDIHQKAKEIKKPLRFMELCGTHAETVAQHGIKNILPENIKLISGPGCPVCVTDQTDIDIVVRLAKEGIPVASYGDAVAVPGSNGSLEQARQEGARVFTVYDVEEALEISKKVKNLFFWGIGFETTTPGTAWAISQGLSVFSSHKLFPPAMNTLLSNKEIKIDGFINPGHVSAIIGTEVYKKFKIPQVVAGFEASDVLKAVEMLLDQILSGEKKVENEYVRLVKPSGNKKAQKCINDIFEICDSQWRGLGLIKSSGLKLKKKYREQDAEYIYQDKILEIKKEIKVKTSACLCGEVLQGLIEPKECPLFKKVCNPDNPQGACMVSGEGSCNIELRFGKQ